MLYMRPSDIIYLKAAISHTTAPVNHFTITCFYAFVFSSFFFFSSFLDFTERWHHTIFIFVLFCLTEHPPSSIHVIANGMNFFFLVVY